MQKYSLHDIAFACFVFLTFLSAGCAPSPTPTIAAALNPTLTQTFLPSPAFTLTPSPTSASTLTRTTVPTRTRTLGKTRTHTPVPPTVTRNYPATVSAAKTPISQEQFRSPDGKWQADVIVRACLETPTVDDVGYEELRVINLETKKELLADSQTIFCGGLGAYGLVGLFWSKHSRYFYYTNARQGVPDGCGYWVKPYWVFDTHTNTKTLLGGGTVSPNKRLFAAWGKNAIVIWDFNDGEIARSAVDEEDLVRGPIAWSPDGQSLVYLQTTSWCPTEGSYLTRLDAPDFKPTFARNLLYGDFESVRWESADELRLFDFARIEWRYVISTNKLEPLTFTPQARKGEWQKFVSDKYHFSFQYPVNWDSDCCRIGGYASTESIVTLADPKTGRPNTDAPFNGFSANVTKKPAAMSFDEYIEIEMKHLLEQQQVLQPALPRVTKSEFVLGGRRGVLLQSEHAYIFVPLLDNQILVIIATLQRKLKWDNALENIFATFEFE